MGAFPGFPANDFDFTFQTLGPALAGLIARDANGVPRAGVLPSRDVLVTGTNGWTVTVAPFTAVRVADLSVLIGGSDTAVSLAINPAAATNSRIDVIYTRPANTGLGESIVAAAVAQGVTSAVPVKPSIPAGAIELATVRVSAGNAHTNAAVITNTFDYSCAAGGKLIVRSAGDLALWSPSDGAEAYCLADMANYMRTSGAWSRMMRPQGVLWSGAWYLADTQTVSLSESVLEQPNGVILRWSNYSSGAARNWDWSETYVSKSFLNLHPQAVFKAGLSAGFNLSGPALCLKEFKFTSDRALVGTAANAQGNGLNFVLREVVGW